MNYYSGTSMPAIVGQICGTLAGGAVGWNAAGYFDAPSQPLSAADASMQNFSNDAPLHSGNGEPVDSGPAIHLAMAAIGAFAGNSLGTRNPDKSVLILGSLIGTACAAGYAHQQMADLHVEISDIHTALDQLNTDHSMA